MTIKQFDKIIEVVRNGGVVIADRYSEYYPDEHEITEYTDIQDVFLIMVNKIIIFISKMILKNGVN